jgi:hypothetical protein
VGRIGVNVLTPLTDPRVHARTKERNKPILSGKLCEEKKKLKIYKFSNALQVRLVYLWQKALWDKDQQESIIIVPLARLLAAKISSLARTHARKEPWLPSQIAVQHKARLSEGEALLHRSHSSSDPTVISPISFHINGEDWKHLHIF